MKEQVYAALDRAVDNGYPLYEWPAKEVVCDLVMYDSSFEDADVEKLLPYVESWTVDRRRQS